MSQAGYNITSTATQAASVMSASYRPSLSSGGAPICAQASSTGYYADLSVGGKIISSLASSQVGTGHKYRCSICNDVYTCLYIQSTI
jgi:hypothetical protein